ncbi:MAG: 3-oxoacyl-[acyl-carrier-protein] reductase [Bacteroidales bacterium]|nr:3-oxoacyl-[acyl-carrier-protein] reductase [Bacteroidales bacterium]
MKLLEGKTAIVTGAARGIGKAIAIKLAEHGANIAFTDLEYNDAAKEVEKQLQDLGVKAKGYASDASKYEETQNLVDEIQKEFGSVDILVNNAGITQDTLMMRMSEQQWDAVINVNLKSVFNFTKAAQKYMLKQRSGSIINMSSVVGVSGNAGQANYSASKAGIIGFTKSVAKEVGSRNIRCNAIAPGFIISEMTATLPEDVRKAWEKQIPLRRGGTPEDVANTTLFLASELSSYVSGQVVNVCGAMNT